MATAACFSQCWLPCFHEHGPSGKWHTTCRTSRIWQRMLRCVAVVVTFIPLAVRANTPADIARIVSEDPANQRFTDDVTIGETFKQLEVPILVGSSVLPAFTLVVWAVYDEHPHECPHWNPSSMEEFLRLDKLKVGPCRELTESEWSSRSNDVRMVLWPSGHVLWMALDGQQVLRNRKGKLVEYRFSKINFDEAIRQIESLICGDGKPSGYYRKNVRFFRDKHAYNVPHRKMLVIGEKYLFQSTSQVAEAHEESWYEGFEFQFSLARPWDDVRQLVQIQDVIRNALPPEEGYYLRLRSEPAYEWIGKTDLHQPPSEQAEIR